MESKKSKTISGVITTPQHVVAGGNDEDLRCSCTDGALTQYTHNFGGSTRLQVKKQLPMSVSKFMQRPSCFYTDGYGYRASHVYDHIGSLIGKSGHTLAEIIDVGVPYDDNHGSSTLHLSLEDMRSICKQRKEHIVKLSTNLAKTQVAHGELLRVKGYTVVVPRVFSSNLPREFNKFRGQAPDGIPYGLKALASTASPTEDLFKRKCHPGQDFFFTSGTLAGFIGITGPEKRVARDHIHQHRIAIHAYIDALIASLVARSMEWELVELTDWELIIICNLTHTYHPLRELWPIVNMIVGHVRCKRCSSISLNLKVFTVFMLFYGLVSFHDPDYTFISPASHCSVDHLKDAVYASDRCKLDYGYAGLNPVALPSHLFLARDGPLHSMVTKGDLHQSAQGMDTSVIEMIPSHLSCMRPHAYSGDVYCSHDHQNPRQSVWFEHLNTITTEEQRLVASLINECAKKDMMTPPLTVDCFSVKARSDTTAYSTYDRLKKMTTNDICCILRSMSYLGSGKHHIYRKISKKWFLVFNTLAVVEMKVRTRSEKRRFFSLWAPVYRFHHLVYPMKLLTATLRPTNAGLSKCSRRIEGTRVSQLVSGAPCGRCGDGFSYCICLGFSFWSETSAFTLCGLNPLGRSSLSSISVTIYAPPGNGKTTFVNALAELNQGHDANVIIGDTDEAHTWKGFPDVVITNRNDIWERGCFKIHFLPLSRKVYDARMLTRNIVTQDDWWEGAIKEQSSADIHFRSDEYLWDLLSPLRDVLCLSSWRYHRW